MLKMLVLQFTFKMVSKKIHIFAWEILDVSGSKKILDKNKERTNELVNFVLKFY